MFMIRYALFYFGRLVMQSKVKPFDKTVLVLKSSKGVIQEDALPGLSAIDVLRPCTR